MNLKAERYVEPGYIFMKHHCKGNLIYIFEYEIEHKGCILRY